MSMYDKNHYNVKKKKKVKPGSYIQGQVVWLW